MGDRANIYIAPQRDEGAAGVFLYAHWGGARVCGWLQGALRRKARWYDAPYLARMIFDEMTAGCQGDETGFGISATISDNEYPIVIVDCAKQRVSLGTEAVPPVPIDGRSWSFAEFAALPLPEDEDGWPAGTREAEGEDGS